MTTNLPLKSTLLTAAAALLCSGLQFAGIDSLAAPLGAEAVQRLPLVLVSARREVAMPAVQQLPQVVVVGRRHAGAQAQRRAAGAQI